MKYSPAYGCTLEIRQAEPDPEAELRKMWDDYDWERFKKKFDERKRGGSLNPGRHAGQNAGQTRGQRPHGGRKAENRRTRNTESNCPGVSGPRVNYDPNQTSMKQVYSAGDGHVNTAPLPFRNRGRCHHMSSRPQVSRSSAQPPPPTHPNYIPSTGKVDIKMYEDNGNPKDVPSEGIVPIIFCDGNGANADGNAQAAPPMPDCSTADYIPPTGTVDTKMYEDNSNPMYAHPDGTEPIIFYDGNDVNTSSNTQAAQPGTSYCITADIHQEPVNHDQDDNESLYDELDEAQMSDVKREIKTTKL